MAGWLAGAFGYNLIFFVLAIIGLLGLAMLHWRVRAPSQAGAAPTKG